MQRGQPSADIGAPDERQHANYIAFLRNEHRFPVLVPGSSDLYETYQSHQPPLYYLLMAPLGDPTQPETGKAMRFFNVLLGIGSIIGLYRLGQWASDREEIAVATAAMGLLPGFVALHGAISNDPLLLLLCIWSAALCILGLRKGWNRNLAVGLGLTLGLALITKSSSLGLIPMVLVAAGWSLKKDRAQLRPILIAAGISLLIAIPWWIRNMGVYGDPLALKAFRDSFGGTAQASMFVDSIGAPAYWTDWVGQWTLKSFFGVFGYMDIFMPDLFYRLMQVVVVLGLTGWLYRMRERTEPMPREAVWLLGILFLTYLGLFVQFNSVYFQAQARYMFPAMAAMALLIGGGYGAFGKKAAVLALASALVLANLFCLSALPTEFSKRTPTVNSDSR